MLESLPDEDVNERVWRIALTSSRYKEIAQIRRDVGDGPELNEALGFLLIQPLPTEGADLQRELTAPFRFIRPSRFSDGEFGVLYTAREQATAAEEIAYYLPAIFPTSRNGTEYRVRYQLISCRVSGRVRDLRPAVASNPWLTGSEHKPCQTVGRQARSLGLDGLVAASARRSGGTNLPVFNVDAASEPMIERDIIFDIKHEASVTYDL